MRDPVLTAEEITAYLDDVFPERSGDYVIDEIAPMRVRIRQTPRPEHLRPGGTVSGPTMFALADCALYYVVLAMVGREAMAVTSSLTINFLNKPQAGVPLICEARLLKLGRRLATGDMTIWSEGQDDPVAHATGSYAIPPR